ncbi:hypothetical protein KAT08_02205 [Candidatus Babeliales bacterium]|nr:hypothetical protein [Candidatus Babeliales bacterium]
MKIIRFTTLVLSVLFISNFLLSYAPTNFHKPYDVNFRMAEWKGTRFRFGTNFEYGTTNKCRDFDENKVGVLRIYNKNESALAMLLGAKRGSDIHQLANNLLPAFAPAADDGERGRFLLDGKFEGLDFTFCGQYRLPIETIPGKFDFYTYIPFRYMRVGNVKWNDQTKDVLNADRDVKRYLTDNISDVVKELGDLDISSWNKTSIGDIIFMLSWYLDFRQLKEHLKNVRITSRIGLTIPSASEKDEDKVFSLPLGNDGAWGVPLIASIDLDFVRKVKAGLEFEALILFDRIRERRLKTDEHQTDFLLLHKGKATKSFGVTWKFNLFVQVQHFLSGLSGMIAYQFLKHDDDKLTAQTNDFSYSIINSAQSLKEWGMQNFVFQLNYDFFKDCRNCWLKPQLSFFYKLPVTGKQVINPHTFGGQLAFNF